MSETCNNDCGSCSADCAERDLRLAPNGKTNVKKILDYNGCVVISGDSLEKLEIESLKVGVGKKYIEFLHEQLKLTNKNFENAKKDMIEAEGRMVDGCRSWGQ